MSNQLIRGLPAGASVIDRQAFGKDAADKYPISAVADWAPPSDRPSAVDLLVGQEGTRIPALVPLRHARMAVSPFTFYRGSAIVMASDLGRSANSGLWAQLCGDAHLSNFGVFGTPERHLLFDINDFDETAPGPFEWDLMRLTASFVLAARDNGLPAKEGTRIAAMAATAYQATINEAAKRSYLDNWYTMVTTDVIEQLVSKAHEKEAEAARKTSKKSDDKKVAKAKKKDEKTFTKLTSKIRRRDAWSALQKLTETGPDGKIRFRNDPPLIVRVEDAMPGFGPNSDVFKEAADSFTRTLDPDRAALVSRYTLIDVAHKVVGVGSVGLPALVGLLKGRDEHDLLPLQFKAAEASVLEPWTEPSQFEQHGQRVVVGQRLMQATGDPFLGWAKLGDGLDVYGRQLRDFKWSVDVNGLRPEQLEGYALLCGGTLALAHARAGDPIALSAYLGEGDTISEPFAQFANTYADLVAKDYVEFTTAIAEGKISSPDGTISGAAT